MWYKCEVMGQSKPSSSNEIASEDYPNEKLNFVKTCQNQKKKNRVT